MDSVLPGAARLVAQSTVLALIFLIGGAVPARAQMGAYPWSLGSRATALGGAGVSLSGGEFVSAALNPAALPISLRQKGKSIGISGGGAYLKPAFLPIDSVVVENKTVSDQLRTGSVDTAVSDFASQFVGVEVSPLPSLRHLTVGVTASLPVMNVAYIDTGETYLPEYVLYRSRPQRPRIHMGVGAELVRGLSVGAGLQIGLALTSKGALFLQSAQGHPSTMRFVSSIKPKAAPHFGVYYETPGRQWTVGAVVRLPIESSNTMQFNSSARAFGQTFVGLDYAFMGSSTLFYDPLTVEVGTSLQYTPQSRLIIQMDYQDWRGFRQPAIDIQGPLSGISISPGNLSLPSLEQVWIPRVGHELQLGAVDLRLGYFYRPSIFTSLPEGMSNLLDPPVKGFSAGLGFQWSVIQVDFFATLQLLENQKIQKQSVTDLGAPGYTAGGKIYGAGFTLGVAL